MGRDNLIEREGLVDPWIEGSGLQVVEDILLGLGEDDGVGDHLEERIALDSEVLAQGGEERVGRGLGRERSVLEDDAADRGCGSDGVEDVASDWIEGDAAFPCRQ